MSRLLTLLPAAALTAAALTCAPSPAQAAVIIDCSAGPVTITSSTEAYVLTGACSTVTVAASNVTDRPGRRRADGHLRRERRRDLHRARSTACG